MPKEFNFGQTNNFSPDQQHLSASQAGRYQVAYPLDLESEGSIKQFLEKIILNWTDYTAASTIVGWSSFTSSRKFIFYKKLEKIVFIAFHLEGTSNSISTTFTLPFISYNAGSGTVFDFSGMFGTAYDNSVALTTIANFHLPNNSSTVTCYTTWANGAWTAAGTKIIEGQFWYITDF